MKQAAVLLHNVRSAHNVGSVLRTADAAGACGVYFSGYTPLPRDKFGRWQKDIGKTALGAERTVEWRSVRNVPLWLQHLKKQGWRVVGVEQDQRALDYRTLQSKGKTLFIFGNEVRGISQALRMQCDALVEIPMHGAKESLNIAVAAGVVLFSQMTPEAER